MSNYLTNSFAHSPLFARMVRIYGPPPGDSVADYLACTAKSKHQLQWAVDHILAETHYSLEWPKPADIEMILGLIRPSKAAQDYVDACAGGKVDMGWLHKELQKLAQNIQRRRRP